ncbi:MAG: HlyC/CorC family transporter, partial [Parvularculaceae bacterium]|nr:HlyC/CorC family transporter [Parvularculaceae bacterium]
LFAMAELALVSSKPARLKARVEAGDQGAAVAMKLLEDPSTLLSTVQIGITLVGVFAGAYGAAAFADDLAPAIARALPRFASRADEAAFAIVVVGITYLSLVVGELVPKRIALAAPERIASLASRPMAVLAFLAHPAVSFLRLSTESVFAVLGLSGVKPAEVSEEEILHMVAEGATSGAIGAEEKQMIEGVLDLPDRNVRSIMTPRTDVVWINADSPPAETLEEISASGHSRFPVARGDADEIVGIIQTKDLLGRLASTGSIDLEMAMRKPVFVPETLSVASLLDALAHSEVRMAIVLDEHGVFTGIVTAADMLGAIAGAKAFSPADRLEPGVRREDGSWLIDGMTPVEDFERLLGVKGFADPENYTTVAGLIVHALQRIAQVGDVVGVRNLKFEVADMDGRRIDKLIVTLAEEEEDETVI